jgi:hypothetical protein
LQRYLILEKETGGRFELISRSGGMFDTETITLEPSTIYKDEDLALYYGDDFPGWSTDFAVRLSRRHSGLTLPAKEDYSLAEIFNESVAEPPDEKIVGFAA